jgi:4-diphosphocytidyl-2C-methyl-D-erythritol kinase
VAVAAAEFYNSLEASALRKYPLLVLFQEFFRENGAPVTLMSGSGSATFALTPTRDAAEKMLEKFRGKFGPNFWTAVVPATDA